jgi:hypothetical protein
VPEVPPAAAEDTPANPEIACSSILITETSPTSSKPTSVASTYKGTSPILPEVLPASLSVSCSFVVVIVFLDPNKKYH